MLRALTEAEKSILDDMLLTGGSRSMGFTHKPQKIDETIRQFRDAVYKDFRGKDAGDTFKVVKQLVAMPELVYILSESYSFDRLASNISNELGKSAIVDEIYMKIGLVEPERVIKNLIGLL